MPAIPLKGDRSAWDAAGYPALHTNDTDTSASSLHHTLGTSASQASAGDHTHDFSALSSGSAVEGQVFTADGSGSATWQTPVLGALQDVHVPDTSLYDGYVLTWSATTGSWVAYPYADWRVATVQDSDANNSDKTFTAPTDTEWQILWVRAEYTSTATVGDRQLEIQIQDGDSTVLSQIQAGATQAESLTYNYLFGIAVPDLTSPRDGNNMMTPISAGTFLAGGQKIRIWDNKTIDASADDMSISLQYAYRNFITLSYDVLSVSNASMGHSASSVALTQHYAFTVSNTHQTMYSSKPILTTTHYIILAQNATNLQTADNVEHYILVSQDATNLQTADNIALAQNVLSVSNTGQNQSADNTVLTYYP